MSLWPSASLHSHHNCRCHIAISASQPTSEPIAHHGAHAVGPVRGRDERVLRSVHDAATANDGTHGVAIRDA